jgi:hypothetical protein
VFLTECIICMYIIHTDIIITWHNGDDTPQDRVHSFAALRCAQFMLHVMLFPMLNVLYCHISTSCSVCVQCPVWLFLVVPWICAFSVCSLGILWMILKLYQLPLLLLVPLLFLHSVHAVSIVRSTYFKIFSASCPHLWLLKLQHLLTWMFLFHYHGLWYPVYW